MQGGRSVDENDRGLGGGIFKEFHIMERGRTNDHGIVTVLCKNGGLFIQVVILIGLDDKLTVILMSNQLFLDVVDESGHNVSSVVTGPKKSKTRLFYFIGA